MTATGGRTAAVTGDGMTATGVRTAGATGDGTTATGVRTAAVTGDGMTATGGRTAGATGDGMTATGGRTAGATGDGTTATGTGAATVRATIGRGMAGVRGAANGAVTTGPPTREVTTVEVLPGGPTTAAVRDVGVTPAGTTVVDVPEARAVGSASVGGTTTVTAGPSRHATTAAALARAGTCRERGGKAPLPLVGGGTIVAGVPVVTTGARGAGMTGATVMSDVVERAAVEGETTAGMIDGTIAGASGPMTVGDPGGTPDVTDAGTTAAGMATAHGVTVTSSRDEVLVRAGSTAATSHRASSWRSPRT
ncbi:hypothetical protein [Mobilicoccus sp.]|uniref:hypothetical protein n=1 Tax=Mobilicoccus sp. TaxID=2034349 RepID=UPI00289DBCDC|nr:hypothetical protein [Mobilicoccus sp.]